MARKTDNSAATLSPRTPLVEARAAIDQWEDALAQRGHHSNTTREAADRAAVTQDEAIVAIRAAVETAKGPLARGPYRVPHKFAGIPHRGCLYAVIDSPCIPILNGVYGDFETIVRPPLASLVVAD